MRVRLEIAIAIAAAACMVVCGLGAGPIGLRAPFALLLLLVLPGFALALVMLPTQRRDAGRLGALTVGLSLAVGVLAGVPMAGLDILSAATWAVVIGAITLLAAYAAVLRHGATVLTVRRPHGAQLLSARIAIPVIAVVAGLAMIGAAVGLARTPLPVPANRGYTVLAITPKAGSTDQVAITVSSDEAAVHHFTLAVTGPGMPTTDYPITLAPGQQSHLAIPVPTDKPGTVTAVLTDSANPGVPYRNVSIGLPLQGPAPVVTSRS